MPVAAACALAAHQAPRPWDSPGKNTGVGCPPTKSEAPQIRCSVPRPGSPVPSTPERREGLRTPAFPRRNIDAGPMRFYYVVGWGIPAIVTGEHAQSGHSRPPPLAWTLGSSSRLPPLGHGVLLASAPDLGRGVAALGAAALEAAQGAPRDPRRGKSHRFHTQLDKRPVIP